ncbi:MAG: hypothetical protein PVS3B3_13650 [Ktedonobacteraceae bacterium]
MKRRLLLAFALLILYVIVDIPSSYAAPVSPSSSAKQQYNSDGKAEQEPLSGLCGVERWSVKTGTDPDASLINLQSTTKTTIATLTSLPAPSSIPANNRVQPTETTVFQLNATLTEYKLEPDSDYHLILNDGAGNTMIGEIPDPTCVGSSSPLLSSIQKARSEFDARYTTTSSYQTANVPVIVTGVGFFDFLHGQTGVAPNGIELHTVLDVQFGTVGGGSGIANGDFETGNLNSWTTNGTTSISTTAHTGSFSAQVGGTSATNGDSSISQTFTAPSTASTLGFWYQVYCPDTVTTDWATATLKDNTVGTTTTILANTCTNNVTWVQVSANVTPADSYTLSLINHDNNNPGDPTYTLFDDVKVN